MRRGFAVFTPGYTVGLTCGEALYGRSLVEGRHDELYTDIVWLLTTWRNICTAQPSDKPPYSRQTGYLHGSLLHKTANFFSTG